VNCFFHPTTVLTLPYPATSYDAILTTIINFRFALKQKDALWADEGVYPVTKEIQLVKLNQFLSLPPQLTETLIQMAETFLAR